MSHRMDAEALRRRTGWVVHHLASTPSTNDLAAQLRDEGAEARTAVVADVQTAGRARAGRVWASPVGGLYVSLLVRAHARDLPAALVALSAVAVSETIERVTRLYASVKWPNDVWLGRKKVAGILLESSDPERLVVLGIGINLAVVPPDLAADERNVATALDVEAGQTVDREHLLAELLQRIDARQADLARAGGRERLETAWTERLALVGERVRYVYAGRAFEGDLEAVSLDRGLLMRDPEAGPIWREAELVQDVRPSDGQTG